MRPILDGGVFPQHSLSTNPAGYPRSKDCGKRAKANTKTCRTRHSRRITQDSNRSPRQIHSHFSSLGINSRSSCTCILGAKTRLLNTSLLLRSNKAPRRHHQLTLLRSSERRLRTGPAV